MKKFIPLTLAALGLLALPQARAWTYSDGDVLLIFRDGAKDVEFDLGNVGQFTGKTNGYTVTVGNWSSNLVVSTFGSLNASDNGPVTVLLVASTTANAWVTSIDPNTTAYQQGPATFGGIYGAVNGVGTYPLSYNVPTNSTPQSYALAASGSSGNAGRYKYASYDYIVTGGSGTGNGVTRLGYNVPFIDETGIPGSLDFWLLAPNQSTTQTPDSLVGTFSISAAGVLTFVAGPRTPAITGFTHAGNVSTFQFPTTIGNTYKVSYTNQLGGAVAAWPVDAGSVVGDGNTGTISHTNSGATAEFYKIQAN